jgi:hypothetical protein
LVLMRLDRVWLKQALSTTLSGVTLLRQPRLVLTELLSQMPTGIRAVQTGLQVVVLTLVLLLAVLVDGRC